ncbi:MAG TPA: hypothetical protein VE991_12365 [Acidimicrobiales bacterium]|nr:hypothetical protein [Acidimicrobiales bacterium]
MPDDRTTVTELATALGMLPADDVRDALRRRPPALAVDGSIWDRLSKLHASGRFAEEFVSAFANGRAFLHAPDALRGRTPVLVEWTGGRRPPGDEVAPVDLRIDHVYLVSCKYLSRTIANPSPARLFDGLLATTGTWGTGDWYEEVAPEAYRELYAACRRALDLVELPDDPGQLSKAERQRLRRALGSGAYPAEARDAYRRLCDEVSRHSAERWAANVAAGGAAERLAWRLLRIGNASYFLLGADPRRPLRLRIASPWDWRQAYQLTGLDIRPGAAGQPQVDWTISYRRRGDGRACTVEGHVEVRWSHGRFAQPPEAKVYLDTPTDELPGYFALEPAEAQPQLWEGVGSVTT